ncbi:MAG TPA: hypothetical protein VMW58_02315 [Anaerolineae bacterium]|nr:hypothetical protein [Anaerolineae bacterium]
MISAEQRDRLFAEIRDNPKFRALIKEDWRGAMKQMRIDAEEVLKSRMTRVETGMLDPGVVAGEYAICIYKADVPVFELRDVVEFEVRR